MRSAQKLQGAMSLEKFAILTCGILVAAFAIPLLVFIQALAAFLSGTTIIFQLLSGEGLFNDRDELYFFD